MVIDKNEIMKILRSSVEDLKNHEGEDSILITTSCDDFSLNQIGNDSIDLRISNTGYMLSNDYEYINTLGEEDFSKYFEKVELDIEKGFDLKPGDILFVDTLERINLVGDLIGRITGRSTFSRFGLTVHCTQEKFSSGINSIAALQIKNNSNTVLKIFPRQKLAQLIIEKTSHTEIPYSGVYSKEEKYKLPVIKPSDREQYDSRIIEEITRLKPRKKSFLKRISLTNKLNTLVQTILGIIMSFGFGILGFFGNLTEKRVVLFIIILLAAIYIIISWYFYKVAERNEYDK